MKRILLILFIVSLFILITSGISQAITVSASPDPSLVNQIVSVNVNVENNVIFEIPQNCTVQTDFGDNTSPATHICSFSGQEICSRSSLHMYTSPGTFTITSSTTCAFVLAPNPATTTVTIISPPPPPSQPPPPVAGGVSVSVIPSSFSIQRDTATTRNIGYNFTITPPGDLDLNSNNGLFLVGSSIIGEFNMPISVTIRNGAGNVNETVNIPVSVIKRAEQLGSTRVTYVRTFSGGSVSVTAQAEINITTAAAADFNISRLQLYFDNGRAETVVKRNQPSLKVYADVTFTGSGLLEGFWEVDGRVLSYVFRNIVYGDRIFTIETPDIPPIPTFETGTHRVRLVLTSPAKDIPFPEVIYFVTAKEYEGKRLPISLIAPQDISEIDFSPTAFTWEGKDMSVTYLIEFLEEGNEKPVFSAYTKKARYDLPEFVLKNIFSPGMNYFWRVTGFDRGNIKVEESQTFRFNFTK
jgi:hypothetical protein